MKRKLLGVIIVVPFVLTWLLGKAFEELSECFFALLDAIYNL